MPKKERSGSRSDAAVAARFSPRDLPGHPLPLGISETARGMNFAVFSRHATGMTLVLYAPGSDEPTEIALDPSIHRTGDVWHVEIAGLDRIPRYGWRADRQPEPKDSWHRFDRGIILTDPYAIALTGAPEWGKIQERIDASSDRRSLYTDGNFDWQGIRGPRIPMADKIIYELHLRGFTRHPSSGVRHPGTYLGLIEKIPYLKELGVTTIELLPICDFDENENRHTNPFTGERLLNYWGYSPIAFFAPKASYAFHGRDGEEVGELKTLVRELHRAGLEVILDVVFNHTAEGGGIPGDPTYSFRGLDNKVYYLLDPVTGAPRNYSGCGNTLNCNHPVVRQLIRDALRYWVAEMKVDGFRFDLAAILSRGRDGEVLPYPPLIESIAEDPILSAVTLIAEPWDATGLFQLGRFPSWGRWAEWNGVFRDDVRRFVRGEAGFSRHLATRLAGSADVFEESGGTTFHSINFVTCHDGFTLADLVAYDRKHNLANGEDNRDGSDHNFSWNCGVEGTTDEAAVVALRARQVRNFLTLLLVSHGTPMLLAGDEVGRSQQGNNNAYCQDNEISWLDWGLCERSADLLRFTKLLIAFRRAHPVLRATTFLTGRGNGADPVPDVSWHGPRLNHPDWSEYGRRLAMHLAGVHAQPRDCDIYLAANNSAEDETFELPPPPRGTRWARIVDTARPSPADINPDSDAPILRGRRILVRSFSCVLLRSR